MKNLLDVLRSEGAVVVDYTTEVKKCVQEIKEHEENKPHHRSLEEIEKMAAILGLKEQR